MFNIQVMMTDNSALRTIEYLPTRAPSGLCDDRKSALRQLRKGHIQATMIIHEASTFGGEMICLFNAAYSSMQ